MENGKRKMENGRIKKEAEQCLTDVRCATPDSEPQGLLALSEEANASRLPPHARVCGRIGHCSAPPSHPRERVWYRIIIMGILLLFIAL